MSHISKTAASILWDAINTGQAVVLLHKARELDAANALIAQGLVYLHCGGDRLWILKAGRRPFGHQTAEIV